MELVEELLRSQVEGRRKTENHFVELLAGHAARRTDLSLLGGRQ